MHLIKLIERRFPNRKASLTVTLLLLSASLLLLAIGLLFVQ